MTDRREVTTRYHIHSPIGTKIDTITTRDSLLHSCMTLDHEIIELEVPAKYSSRKRSVTCTMVSPGALRVNQSTGPPLCDTRMEGDREVSTWEAEAIGIQSPGRLE